MELLKELVPGCSKVRAPHFLTVYLFIYFINYLSISHTPISALNFSIECCLNGSVNA
jgi:hypothetical protein